MDVIYQYNLSFRFVISAGCSLCHLLPGRLGGADRVAGGVVARCPVQDMGQVKSGLLFCVHCIMRRLADWASTKGSMAVSHCAEWG